MSGRLDEDTPGASASRSIGQLLLRLRRPLAPFSAAVGRLHLPYTRKRVRAAHVREALGLLKPGHILRTRSDGDLVNLFAPGDSRFRHTAIWDGERVIEASGGGVVRLDIHDFLMSKDRFQLLEPRWATEALMAEAARHGRSLVGQPYDMVFRLSGDGQYCFKLPYDCYRRALGSRPPVALRRHWGEEVVVSDSYDRGFKVLGEWPPPTARFIPFFTPKLEFATAASEPVADDDADAGDPPAPRRRPLRRSVMGLARISLGVPLLLLGIVSLLAHRVLRRGGR